MNMLRGFFLFTSAFQIALSLGLIYGAHLFSVAREEGA